MEEGVRMGMTCLSLHRLAGIATDLIPEERIPAFVERLCATQTSDIRAINLVTDEFVRALAIRLAMVLHTKHILTDVCCIRWLAVGERLGRVGTERTSSEGV